MTRENIKKLMIIHLKEKQPVKDGYTFLPSTGEPDGSLHIGYL